MTEQMDRRRFLTYTGAAGAATGALWITPSVVGSSTAFAIASSSACKYAGKVVWSPTSGNPWTDGSWVGGNLSGGRPSRPDKTNSVTFTAMVGGTGNSYVWVKFTVKPIASPPDLPDLTFKGISPADGSVGYNGFNSWYRWAFVPDASSMSSAQGYETTIAFYSDSALSNPTSVNNLKFTLLDVDGENTENDGYRDMTFIDGTAASFTGTPGSTTQVTGDGHGSANAWKAGTDHPVGPDVPAGLAANVAVNFSTAVSTLNVRYYNTNYSGKTATYGHSNGLAISDLSWGC